MRVSIFAPLDARYALHPVSVQQLEPSYLDPRKRLSHAVKALPSNCSPGVVVPLLRRGGFGGARRIKR